MEEVQGVTLGSRFGAPYEHALVHLLLTDGEFAEQHLHQLDVDLLESEAAGVVLSVHQDLAESADDARISPAVIVSELFSRLQQQKPESPRRTLYHEAHALASRCLDGAPITEADANYVKQTLQDHQRTQRMKTALLRCVDHLEHKKFDDIRNEIEGAADGDGSTVDTGLSYENFLERIRLYQAQQTNVNRISFDLPLLDGMMRGGLEPRKLMIVMAPTGRGKTLALVHAGAAAIMQGYNVVHCTFEISATDTAMRYDARITGIPINDIALDLQQHLKTLLFYSRKKVTGKLRIREWGSDEASTWDIRAYLKLLARRQQFKPDLLIIDYADLVRPSRARDERRFELSDTVRGLRQLAKDFDCAVLTASQTNREGFRSTVLDLGTIAECAEKANIADVIVGLCQDRAEKQRGRMRIVVLKNRQGGQEGTQVDCFVNTETQLIQENPRQAASLSAAYDTP